MRQAAKDLMSDIALDEAQNDDIVSMVTSLSVDLVTHDGQRTEVRIAPATAYMLISDLELGVNVPRGTKQSVMLDIKVPQGWDRDGD